MGRGPAPRSAGGRRVIRNLALQRMLESELARAKNIRRIRERNQAQQRRREEQRKFGEKLELLIELYDLQSGFTGTAGAPNSFGQGVAGAVEAAAKLKRRTPPPPPPTVKTSLTRAFAHVTRLPSAVYSDVLMYAGLMGAWDKLSYEWENALLKGKYTLYRLVDLGQDTVHGGLVVLGIATEKADLEILKNDLAVANPRLAMELNIQEWMPIEGRVPWPAPPPNAPPPPRYPVMRQG